MKKIILLIFILVIVSHVVNAQVATMDEATQIAYNWVNMVIDKHGAWGKSETATVNPIQELTYNNRRIGYYCTVEPRGYIVISLRKELAAVKIYSDLDNLNPANNKSLFDLIKMLVFRVINPIEQKLGPIESINTFELSSRIETNHQESWDYIYNYIPGSIKKDNINQENYQQGESLLTSTWNQVAPYNNNCPYMSCDSTGNGRALVGCTATAGAQIMKYWSWPPFGVGVPFNDPYDWVNMPDTVNMTSPAIQQAAVAEISQEFGIIVDMDYGCEGSGAPIDTLEGTLDYHYRYSSMVNHLERDNYTASQWWDQVRYQIDLNRPIEYGIWNGLSGDSSFAHACVCDGWDVWPTPWNEMYHMNMGWEDINFNGWYQFDNIFNGFIDHDFDEMLVNIVPDGLLGNNLSGTYSIQSFNYRYFDRDAAGTQAVFNPGQFLQALPGITITGSGTGTYVSFLGNNSQHTKIYTDGDPSEGIAIRNGTIRLSNGGSIKLD